MLTYMYVYDNEVKQVWR